MTKKIPYVLQRGNTYPFRIAISKALIGGLAPLFTMLNSGAPNMTVVNIDNGFDADFSATMINSTT